MRNKIAKNVILPIVVLFGFAATCRAQAPIVGDWQGTLNTGAGELRLVLTDGRLEAVIVSTTTRAGDQAAFLGISQASRSSECNITLTTGFPFHALSPVESNRLRAKTQYTQSVATLGQLVWGDASALHQRRLCTVGRAALFLARAYFET